MGGFARNCLRNNNRDDDGGSPLSGNAKKEAQEAGRKQAGARQKYSGQRGLVTILAYYVNGVLRFSIEDLHARMYSTPVI